MSWDAEKAREESNHISIDQHTAHGLAIELGECRKQLAGCQQLALKQGIQIGDLQKSYGFATDSALVYFGKLQAVMDIARSLPSITREDLARLEEAARK